MPQVVTGELTRHHNQPFYQQQQTPKFFWAGCLGPLLIIIGLGALILRGVTTAAGLNVVRGFILLVLALALIQAIVGGGLFWKSRSSLAKGLLFGGLGIIVLLLLALIGVASLISGFLK